MKTESKYNSFSISNKQFEKNFDLQSEKFIVLIGKWHYSEPEVSFCAISCVLVSPDALVCPGSPMDEGKKGSSLGKKSNSQFCVCHFVSHPSFPLETSRKRKSFSSLSLLPERGK